MILQRLLIQSMKHSMPCSICGRPLSSIPEALNYMSIKSAQKRDLGFWSLIRILLQHLPVYAVSKWSTTPPVHSSCMLCICMAPPATAEDAPSPSVFLWWPFMCLHLHPPCRRHAFMQPSSLDSEQCYSFSAPSYLLRLVAKVQCFTLECAVEDHLHIYSGRCHRAMG